VADWGCLLDATRVELFDGPGQWMAISLAYANQLLLLRL